MTKPLISVIVPIYGVEKYLRKCVDSILAQTYEALEIILVDDGSPDNCGAICDEYAARDDRVRVIHQENGGVSAARNAGLELATGAYIGFADSDDWLEPDMYERLLEALADEEAEIAVCNYRTVFVGGKAGSVHGVSEPVTLERDDAVRMLLDDRELQNYLWNKLFQASLWSDVRFPEGEIYEDVTTTWRAMLAAVRTALIPYVGYNYLVRENSIAHSRDVTKIFFFLEASFRRYDALIDRYPECGSVMAEKILHNITALWDLAWRNRRLIRGKYMGEMEKYAAFAKRYSAAYSEDQPLGLTGRLKLPLLSYAKPWAWLITGILNRVYRLFHPASEAETC